MGTVAITNKVEGVEAQYRTVEATVTFSSSYATGGETLTLTDIGMDVVREVYVFGGGDDATPSQFWDATPSSPKGYVVQVDASTPTAPKLQVFGPSGEVTNGTDLHSFQPTVMFYGT